LRKQCACADAVIVPNPAAAEDCSQFDFPLA
jgi:hypothetical protein